MGLVLVTVVLIVWFLPRREGSQYVYDVDEPWRYGDMIAQYDFPIYKTEETLAMEKDSVLKLFVPYFDYDKKVEARVMEKFDQDFAGGLPGLPAEFTAVVRNRLHRLYQTGIMETPLFNSVHRDTTSMVRVVVGKNVEQMIVEDFYSTMSAYEQLLSDESLSADRQALQRLNLINYIEPNLVYDKARSETAKNDLLGTIPPANGMVKAGQKIIGTGEIVTEERYRELVSLEKEMNRRGSSMEQVDLNFIGNALYVLSFVIIFTIYLTLFRNDYFNKPRNILMLYALVTIFPIMVSLMMQHSYFSFSVYVLPFAFTPIFVRVFQDSRTAFITHMVMVFICAAALRYQFDFIVIQMLSGLVAIYSLREMSSRAQVFKTALMVFIATCFTYFTLRLMQSGTTFNLDASMYSHFMINGVLLLLAYPLMYVVEKAFGFTSNVTLIELSNTNGVLLRRLSEEAPGTFQHSITVSNLAAEIANRIGANSTLVRTGALYHDIGKMKNPAFFTENQQGGVNPYDNLTDKESAQIIVEHVVNGVKLAEENNLPVIIRDFILTHHGHGMAKYFYIKYQNEHPDEIVDKEPFTYPGPNPYTREQAILMMADSCEAASHSLKDYSDESITKLVNQIIDGQVDAGFFTEAAITFRDISEAKTVLIDRLKAIYHTRIKYPKLNR
ncbi:HDIG domain-containing metalloprotein [Hallella sp.]|uniref:HD family phosphohydrolase n=1 Tax=Hallella sp. TaxID=2980186 RepID=UPI00307C5E70